jgi:hypothetical protein
MMRYVTIGRYQFSVVLLLIAAIASPLAFAATYYIWSSKTVPFSVDEPLEVTEFPTSIHFHPGENSTIQIAIVNSVNINYTISLIVTLSDLAYQQSYVQVSDYTYTIVPGNNTIIAWIAVSRDAAPSQQQLTINFLRLDN